LGGVAEEEGEGVKRRLAVDKMRIVVFARQKFVIATA
jgi:hypothetical protein